MRLSPGDASLELPERVSAIISVYLKIAGGCVPLIELPRETLLERRSNAHAPQGRPVCYSWSHGAKLELYPAADNGYELVVAFYPQPEAI